MSPDIQEIIDRAHARELAIKGGTNTRLSVYGGPRADAEPSHNLPRLRPGLDPLPKRCAHCRSGLLELDPPEGRALGRLTCVMCSRQAAWISGGLR